MTETTPRKRGTAVRAVKAEAKSKLVTFEYDGDKYTIDPKGLEELDFLEAYEDGKYVVPVRCLLGQAQWASFRKNHSGAAELAELADAMFEKLGATPGE